MRSPTVTAAGAEERVIDLTCDFCFSSHNKNRHFSVVLGKNALNESDPTTEQTFRVEEIIVHEGFDSSEGNYNNDIGMNILRWFSIDAVM